MIELKKNKSADINILYLDNNINLISFISSLKIENVCCRPNIVDISERGASQTTNRLGSVQERIDKKCPGLDIISGRVSWTLCHCDPLSPHISCPHLMRSCGPQAESSPVQPSAGVLCVVGTKTLPGAGLCWAEQVAPVSHCTAQLCHHQHMTHTTSSGRGVV